MSAPRCSACGSTRHSPRPGGLAVCPDCGVTRLDPFPSPEDIRALYSRGYFDAWGVGGPFAEAVRPMKVSTFRRRLRELGRPKGGRALLDVGCALGHLLEAARIEGYDPWGVEISSFAAREAAHAFPGRVAQGTLEEAAFPDARFDVVVLCDVLEHVPDVAGFLREVRRVTRPGGRLLVVAPDFGSLSSRCMGRWWFHRHAEHLHYFTRRSLAGLLARSGFRALRVFDARKAFTLDYLDHQIRAHARPPLAAAFGLVRRVLPPAAARRPRWMPSGEFVCHAERVDAAKPPPKQTEGGTANFANFRP